MSKQGQEPTDVQPGMKENQTVVANCIESDICFSGFARESQTDGIVACSDSSSYIEVNGGINNLKEVSVQSECISGYSSNWQRQCPLNPVAQHNVSPLDLSALANIASAASTTTASERINRPHSGCGFDELFPMHVTLSAQQNSWIVNCTPRKHQNVIPSKHPYDNDINLLAGARGAFSHTRVSEFAPITPDKPTRAEMKEVSEIGNLYIENRTEKRDEQANELIDVTVDVNGLQCNEELQMPVSESSMIATPSKENQNPDSGGSLLAEPEITTPQQKQRKRKHRPKVITERKPRKPRKPVTPKPGGTQETPTGKRKYVRKNTVKIDTSILPGEENAEKPTGKRKYVRRKGLDKDSMVSAQEEIEKGTTHPETLEHNKKPCRRALDFNTEGQERDDSSACKPNCNLNSSSGTENLCKEGSQCGIEVAAEKPQIDIAFELNQSVNQKLKENLSLPEDQAPGTPLPTKNNPSHRRQNTHSQKLKTRKGKDKATAHDGLKMNEQPELDSNAQLPARSPINTKCRSNLLLEGGQTNKSAATQQADTSVVNSYGSHYNSLYAYQILLGMVFPKIQKRKRTGKGQNAETSSASSSITPAKSLTPADTCLADKGEVNTHGGVSTKLEAGKNFSMDKLQTFYCIMAPNQREIPKKKRTRRTAVIRDLASLNGMHPGCCSSQSPVDYDTQTKLVKPKQTKKRNSLVNPACASTSEAQVHKKLTLSNQHQLSAKLLCASPEEIWKRFLSVDTLLEQFNRLDINRESSTIAYKEHNALVPYNVIYQEHNVIVVYRDGTIVPFVPTRKQRPRPKVDLDEETNKVWKILLENINNKGIDGTNEEKAKWREEEKRVFSGRADTFIARMELKLRKLNGKWN